MPRFMCTCKYHCLWTTSIQWCVQAMDNVSKSTYDVGILMCIFHKQWLQITLNVCSAICEGYRKGCHATFNIDRQMSLGFGRGWTPMSNVDLPFCAVYSLFEKTTSDVSWQLYGDQRLCGHGIPDFEISFCVHRGMFEHSTPNNN